MRTSIKDIAQELGVSNATVSLVLNGKEKEGRVGKEMAERIRQKAIEMNYEPNNLARSLRMGQSYTIGLIIADISNLFFANLAFHIQEQAEKYGYSVIITNTNENESKMKKMIQVLKSRQVDGFIIVPTDHGKEDISKLMESNIPIVLLDRYFPGLNVSHVVVDNYHASFKAANHLISNNCQRIGLVIYNNNLPHMLERKRGYIEALQKTSHYDPSLIKEISYTNIKEDVLLAVEELLNGEYPIDGIYFATNSISVIGIKHMIRQQINIPDDVKVICFDENDAFDLTHIPIPFVQQPIPEMGKTAVEILIKEIKKEMKEPIYAELSANLQNMTV